MPLYVAENKEIGVIGRLGQSKSALPGVREQVRKHR